VNQHLEQLPRHTPGISSLLPKLIHKEIWNGVKQGHGHIPLTDLFLVQVNLLLTLVYYIHKARFFPKLDHIPLFNAELVLDLLVLLFVLNVGYFLISCSSPGDYFFIFT
jgi:hypothetical protein